MNGRKIHVTPVLSIVGVSIEWNEFCHKDCAFDVAFLGQILRPLILRQPASSSINNLITGAFGFGDTHNSHDWQQIGMMFSMQGYITGRQLC